MGSSTELVKNAHAYECIHLSLGAFLGGPVRVKAKELKQVGTESEIMGAGLLFKFMGVSSQLSRSTQAEEVFVCVNGNKTRENGSRPLGHSQHSDELYPWKRRATVQTFLIIISPL